MKPTTLLIDLGDLPSLVVLTLEPEARRLVLFHPRDPGPGGDGRMAAVKEHAEAFGIEPVHIRILPSVWGDPAAAGGAGRGLDEAQVMLHAAALARESGCSKILWPAQVGPDHRRVGDQVVRANLVMALAEAGRGGASEVPIELPLVDLSDEQVVELAEDGGAPMRMFWPCRRDGRQSCGSCPGCRRWQGAFDRCGLGWPWEGSSQLSAVSGRPEARLEA